MVDTVADLSCRIEVCRVLLRGLLLILPFIQMIFNGYFNAVE